MTSVKVDSDVPYTGYNAIDTFTYPEGKEAIPSLIRPVLPDRIDIVLDIRDRFRDLRYTWLTYRANRTDGTLVQMQRFDSQMPKLKRDREEFILRSKSGLI